MKHVVDPGMLRLLRRGVESGLWTLENLDTPSPGFKACTGVDRRTFPSGYEGVQFRNLLRDIPAVEAVQAVPDPKDFDTVLPPSNAPAQDNKLPITLDEEESLNPISKGTPLEATEHQGHANDLETVARPQALPWE